MISEVVMPQMGADMEEGTIVRWLKAEGDGVERGEIIAEIETDKANVEIEAFDAGTFRKTLAQEGDTINVGDVIAIIAAPDDDISQYAPVVAAKPPAEEAPTAKRPEASAQAGASPRAAAGGRVRASPVARKLAEQEGLDLSEMRGSGPGGRIVQRDVKAALETRGAAPAPAGGEVLEMSRMRQTIARRMTQSKQQAPHYYITVDIDMAEAEQLRHQVNDTYHRELHVSVNDLIVKASAMALARHRIFNSWFVDGTVRQHDNINVCIAIALDDGLIAPAILDCQRKGVVEIGNASRDLAKRAKSGALKPDELSGGTFTVSNLGMFDVETLVAIIQPPQTAILGVGAVREVPVVRDNHVAVGHLMKAALSADHRVTDGAQGAKFLHEIRQLLEHPAALLIQEPEG